MLRELMRFYREAPGDLAALDDPAVTLGDYLAAKGYGAAVRDDHLAPMAAAIWSSPTHDIMDYPAASFIRFCSNHGLLQVRDRPVWRTVEGGSRSYVARFAQLLEQNVRLAARVVDVLRLETGQVAVKDSTGQLSTYDHVVIASHADQALAMLNDRTADEVRLLGAFRYTGNRAVLHTDEALMPQRRAVWSSWNYLQAEGDLALSYWMNRLQDLPGQDLFVTLNPPRAPRDGAVLHEEVYEHPVFDTSAIRAQAELWSLQGVRNTWFCGAYFGAGFHEDGLQAGLAVAEQLGGVRRPWSVNDESGRIKLSTGSMARNGVAA
jgi:predicted NAD/FAD-binding protein